MHLNVREIGKLEDEALRARSIAERFGDLVAQNAGRVWFIALHGFWFGAWMIVNSGLIRKIQPFDAFPSRC